MAPSIHSTHPVSTPKSAVGSFHCPISVPVDASSLALSTAAAVAAINSDCTIQRAPPNAATSSSAHVQRHLHPAPLVPHHRQSNNINVPQHHLVMNPIHLSPAYPLPNKYTTHSVFTNTKLRRGKWTQEEERFANALIDEFEKGTIQDCENGCTLRAFLSRKLHCAPMRISKKYAGKSIGKHVFLSRNSNNLHSHQQVQLITPKLRRLEFQFHMSLVQEGSPGMQHDNIQMNQAFLSGNKFGHIMPGYPIAFRSSAVNNENGTVNNVPHPCQRLPNQAPLFQWPIAGVPQGHHPTPNIVTMPNATMHMQQNLYTTFKDAHKFIPVSSHHLPTTSQTNACHLGGEEVHVAANVTDQRGIGLSGGNYCNSTGSDRYSEVASDQQSVTTNDQLSTLLVSNVTGKGANVSTSGYSTKNDTIDQSLLHPPPVTNQLKPVRLNLEGRIKKLRARTASAVSSTNELAPATSSVLKTGALPEYAHPCIDGIKLHLSVENDHHVVDDPISSEFWGDSDSHISADAYALFAQQCTMAVSKHSAYCMGDTVSSYPETGSGFTQIAKLSNSTSSGIVHASKPKSSVIDVASICLPSVPPQNEIRHAISASTDNGAAFNATNLQIHHREAEEKARVDQASKNTRNTTCDSTKHTSINIGEPNRHVNLISGSEQSSDMGAGSTDGSTRVSCSGPGSDNASEDSTSDDTNNSGTASQMTLSRKHNIHYSTDQNVREIGESQMKRQKGAVMIMDD